MEIVWESRVTRLESSNPGNVMVDDRRITRFWSLDPTWAERGPKVWNIPNLLTLFRIFLVPLLVVVLLTEIPDKEYWGLGIFLLAARTG